MRYLKKIFNLLLLFVVQVTIAQNSPLSIKTSDLLLLTKVGTPNQQVKIDGLMRKIGYRFGPDKKIELKKGEYIKVTNLETGIPDIKISGNDLVKTKTSTISDFIRKKTAGSKGTGSFGDFLEAYPWYMIEDTLYIPTDYLLDNRHAFFLKTIPGNEMLPQIPYDSKTNELVLTKDYFVKFCKTKLNPGRVFQFRVEYWEGHEMSEVITDNFFLEYIPY